jgi:hypothetical protein
MDNRFSNRWPPPDLWGLFPNWAFARVKGNRHDRDETTLEPADEQDRLNEEVDYTAGEAELANGVVAPALLELIVGKAWGVEIFLGGAHWSLQLLDDVNGWTCVSGTSFEDRSAFPMVVRSRLTRDNERPLVEIRIDGKAK